MVRHGDPAQLRSLLIGIVASTVAACPQGSTTTPVDTSDSGAVDSGAGDSAGDTGAGDTWDSAASGDTGDTGPAADTSTDSGADSGETGETGGVAVETATDTGDTGVETAVDSGDSGGPPPDDSGDSGGALACDSGNHADTDACDDQFGCIPEPEDWIADTAQFGGDSFGPPETLGYAGCAWPPGYGYLGAHCPVGFGWDPLPMLTLTESLDDLTVFGSSVDWSASWVQVASSGTPCAGYTDQAACLQEVEDIDFGWPSRLVSTTGGTVRAWSDEAAQKALLGDIDTPDEALLWAQLRYPTVSGGCLADRFAVRAADGGGWQVVASRIGLDCAPVANERIRLHVAVDGTTTLEDRHWLSYTTGCIGRRAPGTSDRAVAPCLGDLLARHAELEAESVHAFEQLHDELVAHGAPQALRDAARAAAADEVRHARQVGRLARRFGARPRAVPRVPHPVRSLAEIAVDNMVHGCVGETWGALVGLWQADHAHDPRIGAVMAAVASDEVGHAALSWRLHAWLAARLTPSERAAVTDAARQALARLGREATAGPLDGVLGLPDPAARQELVASLGARIAA